MKDYWLSEWENRSFHTRKGSYTVDTLALGHEAWDGKTHTAQTVVLREITKGIKSERISVTYYTYPTEEELIAGHWQAVEDVREQIRKEMEAIKLD